jgi:arabinogalactan oligomer/maltooligosaccharide transport system permease protein
MKAGKKRRGAETQRRKKVSLSFRVSASLRLCVEILIAAVIVLLPTRALAAPIRLWHAYRDDELKALEAVLALWKGEPVDAVSIPYDAYQSKVSNAVPLGEGPDLFINEHKVLGDYRHLKVVAPVGDALEPGVFSEPALAAVTDGGVAWAVPLSQKCVALYVNTDLVKQVPPDLEGFTDLAGKLPNGAFPLAFETKNPYYVAALLSAFGGELLDTQDQFGLSGPAAVRAVELDRWLVEKRAVPEDADGDLVTKLFGEGQAAFAISGPWLAASLSGKPVHYRVAKLPVVRATGQPMRPLLGVESVMLTPAGAARPEVRALARLLASKEAAEIRARWSPTPSARVDVVMPEGDVRTFAEQARIAVPMPSSRAMQSVWDPANRAILKVLRHDADADTALAEAKRRFDDVRRPLPVRASPVGLYLVLGAIGLYLAFRWVKLAREPGFRAEVKRSLPAYAYVLHAVLAVGVLVILPLLVGAATSLFAGSNEEQRYVGLANFWNILTARGGPLLASGSFYVVLLVTILWTVSNLAFHVGIGVTLGLLLSRPTLRLKAVYRVLLIIPWAVPSYVTALAWKGMFHRQFGALTALIHALNHLLGTHLEPIAWFAKFSTAFAANLVTNVWLGFPFMMVVTLGALTAVPEDVLEAAKVDGATRWQRLRLVTLPIIRPVLMPSVTLGAIWTFNMFNVVFLVSGGDPDGTTDILISEAYRWAFTRQNQYGYAAAYAVLIFLLLAGFTRLNDWRQKRAQAAEAKPALVAGTGAA